MIREQRASQNMRVISISFSVHRHNSLSVGTIVSTPEKEEENGMLMLLSPKSGSIRYTNCSRFAHLFLLLYLQRHAA
jgi:hypothetical protein